jgi:ABC-type molybdate transport system ATPase subunit
MRLEVELAATLGAFQLDASFSSDALVTALFGRSGSG